MNTDQSLFHLNGSGAFLHFVSDLSFTVQHEQGLPRKGAVFRLKEIVHSLKDSFLLEVMPFQCHTLSDRCSGVFKGHLSLCSLFLTDHPFI